MKMSDLDEAGKARVKELNETFMAVIEQSMARLSVDHETNCLMQSEDLPDDSALLICGKGVYLTLCSLHEQVRELHATSLAASVINRVKG